MKDNKLIAEFMEVETSNGIVYQNNNTNEFHRIKYHESWDWLMPVVEKIEDMGCDVLITNGECTISGDNDYYVESIGKSRRGATYDAVVEFINEYNKTNK